MIKIGITGSIASGKTTVSKIISKKRGPLFVADEIVKKIYKKRKFINSVKKSLKILQRSNIKENIKKMILMDRKNLKKLERILHPSVREEMHYFLKKNQNKRYVFLEIPLLIESKLTKYFDLILFVKSKRELRKKRYLKKTGNLAMFNFLNKQQKKDSEKMKFCDHIIVNNSSLPVLKKKVLNIVKLYERNFSRY